MALFPKKENNKFIKIINNFLTDDEITFYYNKANNECKEEAYFSDGLYRGYFTDITLANILKNRIKEYLPEIDFIINDHFRMSKYNLGSFLPIHEDRVNIFNGYKSIYTLNIFLNDTIGGTSFWSQQSYGIAYDFTVPATRGKASVFDITYLHRGEMVKENQKMLLRTDVMIPIKETIQNTHCYA